MIFNLSFDDAADIIDVYGPDEVFWPTAETPALKRLVANDPEFRDYVENAKWIEEMLSNWTSGDDGATIDLDDEDFAPGAADNLDEPEEIEPRDPMDVSDDDIGFGAAEPDPDMQRQGGGGAGSDGDLGEEEKPIIIDLDPDDIKDVDGLLEDFIRQQMQNADPTEFRVFTRDYDGLIDIKVPDHVSLEQIDQKVAQTTGPLQKDLRRLIAARSQVKRIPGMRSGRLHAPNLHRIMAGDDRVFTRRQEAESLDTAISLLIDCSGSMSGERTVLAVETAYALGSVLAKLGIAFECLGFTDRYSDPRVANREYIQQVQEADEVAKIIRAVPIVMPKFKTFEERWTIPVQKRFGHVHNMDGHSDQCGYSMGSTPEGCGLEFSARRLLARKEKRKILISMTDGEPGGHVYNPRSMADYMAYQKQSVQMVKSIEAAGVDLVGVGIQHNGPAGYYSNHMCIQKVEDMPRQLLGLLKKFIVGK